MNLGKICKRALANLSAKGANLRQTGRFMRPRDCQYFLTPRRL
jgi:hypothetical protein